MNGKTVDEGMGMASLPEELLREILLFKSAGELNKLKLVCKCWFRLITSSEFVESHIRRGKSRLGIVHALPAASITGGSYALDLYYMSFDDIDSNENAMARIRKLGLVKFLRDHHGVTDFVMGYCKLDSCRGLLLVGIALMGDCSHLRQLLVWNPVTGSSMLVPAPSNGGRTLSWKASVLITYNPYVHRYKLVWTSTSNRASVTPSVWNCYVLELVGGNQPSALWKELTTVPPEARKGMVELASVSTKKEVHWLMHIKETSQLRLLILDLTTEKFKLLDCSSASIPDPGLCHFFALNGTFYGNGYIAEEYRLKQWVLEDFEKPKWSSMRSLIEIPPPPPFYFTSMDLIAVLDDSSKFVFHTLSRRELVVYEAALLRWRTLPLVPEDGTATINYSSLGYGSRVCHLDSLVN